MTSDAARHRGPDSSTQARRGEARARADAIDADRAGPEGPCSVGPDASLESADLLHTVTDSPLVTCCVCVATLDRVADRGLVEPAELNRALAFRHDDDRRRFIAGRCLAKRLVAERAGVQAQAVRILTRCRLCGSTDHGKPYAEAAERSWPTSIAHAGNRVAVAVSEGVDVGVDIEPLRERAYAERVVRAVASTAEIGAVRDAEDFLRLWVCKEAILKCTGEGLMTSPTTLTLDFGGPEPTIVEGPPDVRLRMVSVPDGYFCAVAVATADALALKIAVLD